MNEKLNEIAKQTLGMSTLESRNNDHLDFYDLSVWQIKQALEEAYKAGGKDGWEDGWDDCMTQF